MAMARVSGAAAVGSHDRDCIFAAKKHAAHVNRHQRVPGVFVGLHDASRNAIARIVDEYVEAPEPLHGRRDHALDVLVNNAGYGIPGSVVETDEDAWDALMAVNVRGVFLCSKYAIPVMRAHGGGAIVNTASVVAAVGIGNRAAYCASKGAVAALTRAIAIDHVGDGIRCN